MKRAVVVALVSVLAAAFAPAAGAKPRVLTVGTYKHVRGQFKTIQAAVNAAKSGDWILIGPGDYKTTKAYEPRGRKNVPAAVLITKANLHLRGMNRNTVIVDGTRPGSSVCSRRTAAQNFGPRGKKGRLGLNGIMVYKADGVWVQNLTACNFLSGHGDAGNEIWWNGGHGSKRGGIGGWGFLGSYLNATSTYFSPKRSKTAAQYGIFSSSWNGGTWDQTYASNFSDSGYYIGACLQQCNQTINHAWAEFNSLGYSGSNSGGRLIVKKSEWDHNMDGFDTNSQNGDNPPPQNGACPDHGISAITHTHSCWVLMNNYIHDNNNPNVPGTGLAGETPVGTGLSLTGARNDTVMNNRIVRNNAWGVLVQIFPDDGPPCTGGTRNFSFGGLTFGCLYDQWGNAIRSNRFSNNGSYGHATNGDIAALNLESGHPTSCYRGNLDPAGLTTSPSNLQQTNPVCNGAAVPANPNAPLVVELLCGNEGAAAGAELPCPGGHPYPTRSKVIMHPLPRHLKSMPNPCAGVPKNAWCEPKGHRRKGRG
jgi:hypothetical protein